MSDLYIGLFCFYPKGIIIIIIFEIPIIALIPISFEDF